MACDSEILTTYSLDTGSIGPVTTMPAFRATFGELSAILHGVIVSSILLPGAITALISGVLADRYGRTRLIALGTVTYGIGAGLECAAPILAVFIVGRLIKGLGEGLFLSTVYVQVSEISPAHLRGTLTSLPQFLITVGLVTGFFICYGTAQLGDDTSASWRLPMGLGAVLAFVFAAFLSLVPPSPRWLLAKGKVEQARAVVQHLGISAAEQEELLSQSTTALEHSTHLTFTENVRETMRDFATAFSPPFRRRTAFGCFIMAMQQFSGIDGVLYYAPILFKQAGLSSTQATFLASGVSALLILGTTIPATLLADRWGRRTSSLVGGTLISALMVLMGSLYAANEVHATFGAGRWAVIVSIYLFAIVFSATWAIGFRTFLVESLPRRTRSSASSLAQSSCWVSCSSLRVLIHRVRFVTDLSLMQIANYVVALTTPILIASSTFGAYYLFALCTMLCTILCAFFMFETKGQSLEVIEQRYLERESQARSTGRWAIEGFRLRRIQTSHT